MDVKLSRESFMPARVAAIQATPDGRAFRRAGLLLKSGNVKEARRILLALAGRPGQLQALARTLLTRGFPFRPPVKLPQVHETTTIKFGKTGLWKLAIVRLDKSPQQPPKRWTPVQVRQIERLIRPVFNQESVVVKGVKLGGGFRNPLPRPIAPTPRQAARPKRSAAERTAVAGADMIRRTPHLDLPPDPIAPGTSFTVKVYVDKQKPRPGETSKDVEIQPKTGEHTYAVEVWLAGSPHFVFDEPRTRVLTLDVRKPGSAPIEFTVRVADKIADPSGAIIFAYFCYGGRPCGQVSRAVPLATPMLGKPPDLPVNPPRPPSTGFNMEPDASRADLLVEVTDPKRDRRNLFCRVSSRLLGPDEQPTVEEWLLPSESGDLVDTYMQEFVDDSNHPAYSLIGAGKKFYKVAPESFKRVLWTLIDRGTPPSTILITSDEPNIPWELMVPFRKAPGGTRAERRALGVEFRVGRWTREGHDSPPSKVPLSTSYVIAPRYQSVPSPLPKAAAEVHAVLKAVPGARITPAVLKNIKKQLSREGRSLLHFVCHGVAGQKTDVQAIFLDGGTERLTSLEVTEIPQVKEAFKKQPMVFLNACEVGRPAVALTGIGGFAAAFLELGAAAVIAPLWSVKDTIAFEVARKFYAALAPSKTGAARKSYAEVMQEIRALAYDEDKGEDTYAAYCYYGDPDAGAS